MTIVIAKKRKTQKKLKLPIQLALVGQASLVKVCLFEDEKHIHCHNHCVSCKRRKKVEISQAELL